MNRVKEMITKGELKALQLSAKFIILKNAASFFYLCLKMSRCLLKQFWQNLM